MAHPRPAAHRTILVVDVEGFGDECRTNPHQVAVRAGLYKALQQAFGTAKIAWSDCDREDRGDGVFVLAPAEVPKSSFVESLPHALVTALRAHNQRHCAEERIRLRLALHAGEVNYDDHGVTAAAINLTFRLLDAPPLKAELAKSPGVLAIIASHWFYDEVIRHSPASNPAAYRPVQVDIKETKTIGWICLPDHPDTTGRRSRQRTETSTAGRSLAVSAKGIAVIPTNEVHAIAFHPDGDRFAVATGMRTVPVFDTATGRELLAVRQQRFGLANMNAVAFSPNGVILTTGGYEWIGYLGSTSRAIVQHWNSRTGQRYNHTVCGTTSAETVHAIAYHPDGRRLATSSTTSTAKVWLSGQDAAIFTLAHGSTVQGVAFSPDGRWLATADADKTARIWDIHTGQQCLMLTHEYYVQAVAFSPDGQLLATASTPVYIWNAQTGSQIRILEPITPGSPLCHDVTFSPDGRLLAGAFIDHTVRIWDTYSGNELLSLAHEHEARVVRFSPDGRWLVTGHIH